ncbi:8-oxo-dGTP diphosphatase [Enterococcus cecorum]|uniref:8-oxo-dGTP diphosphatase n=1 Tax=Enterococcus cecorum TaxID=44008 RepID=UPI0032C4AEE0
MSRVEKCTLTNMCMIQKGNQVLVQNRLNPNWPGIVFPGGHVEEAESLVDSVIREIKEETGLTLHSVTLCGVKQFYMTDKQTRYLVFLYRSDDYSGELQSSNEGEVYWLDRDELEKQTLAHGFDTMIPIFENPNLSENFHQKIDGKWQVENK